MIGLIHMQSNGDQHQPDETTTFELQGCMVKANEMNFDEEVR